MKRTLLYILVLSWLFGWLDWQTIHQTRWVHPERIDWMHAHEKEYSRIVYPLEFVLCTPCMALKPVFLQAALDVEASREEQAAIVHADKPTMKGFYHLVDRRYSWTFVGWLSWFLYWLVPSLVWLFVSQKIRSKYHER